MKALRNLVSRATVAMSNAAAKMQALQLRLYAGEVRDSVEHFEDYGFTAHALPGAEAIVVSVGGDRSNSVAVRVSDRRYRPVDLQPGEVCIYHHEGDRIVLRNGRKVEVETLKLVVNATESTDINSEKITLNGEVEMTGAVKAQAGMSVNGSMENNNVDIGSGHRHKDEGRGTPV